MAKKTSRPAFKSPEKAPEQEDRKGAKKTFDEKNRGVLFQNDKGDNENRPDYTGNFTIEIPNEVKPGELVKFRVAGWLKSPKDGPTDGSKDYLSLNIQKNEPYVKK